MGEKVITFETNDKIENISSKIGNNNIKYSYAYGKKNIYVMLLQKYTPIQAYENSTKKDEYDCLYKKDVELKGDKIIFENEGIVKYGNDFVNYKIVIQNYFFCY